MVAARLSHLLVAAVLAIGCTTDDGSVTSRSVAMENGPQQTQAHPSAGDGHLHLNLRITETGDAEVVSAADIPGQPVVSDYPVGDYLIQVAHGGQTLSVQGLPDPFEMRGFGAPPGVEHHESRQDAATIGVKVPGFTSKSQDLDQLAIRIYKADTGGESIGRLNAETLAKLEQAGQLQVVASISGAKLARGIRDHTVDSPGH